VSSSAGCPVRCRMCDAGSFFKGFLTGDEMLAQIHHLVRKRFGADRVRAWVQKLYEKGILVVGLTYPVVPRGEETIRVQINAAHTEADIEELLEKLKQVQAEV